jgi:hypothetical protein
MLNDSDLVKLLNPCSLSFGLLVGFTFATNGSPLKWA